MVNKNANCNFLQKRQKITLFAPPCLSIANSTPALPYLPKRSWTPSTKSSLASTSTASLQTTLPLHTRGQALRGSSDPSAAKMSHLQAPGICHSTHQGIGYIERIRQPTEKYDRRRNYTLLTSYVLYWG